MAVNSFRIGYGFLHCSRNNETGFGGRFGFWIAGKSVAGKQGLVARFWEELKEGKKTSGLSGGGDRGWFGWLRIQERRKTRLQFWKCQDMTLGI